MTRRIVSAGLPSHIPSFLARQLEDVSVLMTFSGDDALTEVLAGKTSILFVDSGVLGLPAESVIRALREDPAFDMLPIVYCVAEEDRQAQEVSREQMTREFPGVHVLVHPVSLADVGRVTNMLLAPRAANIPATGGDLHVALSAPPPSVAASSQPRCTFHFRRAS